MAWAQGHLKALHQDRATGGILYIDGRSAFYSALREGLVGREIGHTAAFLNSLAEAVFEEPSDRLHFMAAALGPGLLAENDVPEPVRRVLAASLKNAWYSIGGDHKHLFRTGSGTSPGSPIADVMFQVLFAEAVRRIEHLLAELSSGERRRHVDTGTFVDG